MNEFQKRDNGLIRILKKTRRLGFSCKENS